MRIAYVSIPHFVCAVEVSRNRDLTGLPLIIGDAEQPKRVLDCSAEASAMGIRGGMAIHTALAECPDATVVLPDFVLYRNAWEKALKALSAISPEIEDEGWGAAYVNVKGLDAHYASESALAVEIREAAHKATSLDALVGIADGKFIAFAAATTISAGETLVVKPENQVTFLARFDVDILPVAPEVIFRLHLLGLSQIGDVATLTLPELQSQFGFLGKRLWQLANSMDDEPLRPRRDSEELSGSLNFEAPVAGIDILVASARQLLSRLRSSLNGRAVRELTLQAELTSGRGWERHLVFREPVSEEERLSFLLRSALTNFPPPQAIHTLSLRLSSLTGESGKQLALGQRARRERQLTEAIRQLKVRYGYSPIYRCVDVEAWSAVPEERQILVESDA